MVSRKRHNPQRAGFTLVELMVVVGIIALLIAIVLPAVNQARIQAKVAATANTIRVLGTGLEQFRSDMVVGGDYPPSASPDRIFNPHAIDITSLPTPPDHPSAYLQRNSNEGGIIGANFLVWALAGADLLGTPGFLDKDNANFAELGVSGVGDFGGWETDTFASAYDPNSNYHGLYTIQRPGEKPLWNRTGPYVDVSQMELPKADGTIPGMANYPQYKIPAAKSYNSSITGANGKLNSLVFLDNFDQPILYYKANPQAPAMVAAGGTYFNTGTYGVVGNNLYEYPLTTSGQYSPNGVYNLLDNYLVTGVRHGNRTFGQGMDLGAGIQYQASGTNMYHPLATIFDNWPVVTAVDKTPTPVGSFANKLYNPNITATWQAYKNDSYILLSAGPDGIFGSGDDIANFQTNQGQ